MNVQLPPLSIFAARSFWLLIATLLGVIAQALGWDVGAPDDLADALLPFGTAFLGFLAYRERLNPKRSLTLTGPIQ
ncbi:MAG: hypothetical protein CSA72_10630 [Rhodobacterales bacterium]|nr:MAG: hypothetical protein CSA72_10630 [Rhodobacterales bacterium]